MNSDDKHIIYTAKDIEQYFSGKLSVQQMHAMEKAALDDPFLAEAMEGYEGMKEKDWKKQLTAVHQQITDVVAEAKIIPMHRSSTSWWWKAAAAVLIIGLGSALTYVFITDGSTQKTSLPIAQVKSTNEDTVIQKDNTALVKPVITNTGQLKSSSGYDSMVTRADIAQNNAAIKPNDDFVYRPETKPVITAEKNPSPGNNYKAFVDSSALPVNVSAAASNNVAASNNNYNGIATPGMVNTREQEKTTLNEMSAEASKRKSANKNERTINNFFNAQVVSADNSPLPFTNISLKSENFGTYADVKGNFRLFSTDTLLNIEVRSVGYLPRTFSLRSNQPLNRIVLQEDLTALKGRADIQDKEAIASQRLRRAMVLSDTLINVEPADGWDNYNTYVANNLNIPEDLLKNEFHGEVELTFDVKANGAISNIRINKSMGEAYDEAAKRLIQQGPQWKVKKGRKSTASVKLQF